MGAISDSEGNFKLHNICKDEIDLKAQFLGYTTVIHHHDFYSDDQVDNYHIFYLSPKANVLEGFVVEGQEIVGDFESMSLETIDKETLVTQSTQSLASVISDIQGVTFVSTGSNVQLPVIHGLYGNRILIINNGVKHGFQNWGTDHAPEIDVASASNISVLKGSSGVKYGPDALGGVVVVNGNPLELSKKFHGGVSTGYQTNGRGYNASTNFGTGYKKFSYHLGGNHVRVGDLQAPDYSLTNTGKVEWGANLGVRYHLPKWDFKLYYSYVDQNFGILRPSAFESGEKLAEAFEASEPLIIQDFSYTIAEPRQKTTHHLATAGFDWYTDLGKVSFLISQQINLRKEFDIRRNSEVPIIDLQLNTSDGRLEWNHSSVFGFEGTVGLQYFSQNNDNNPGTNTTAFVPNYNSQRFSIYAIESTQKGRNTYEFGLRLDHERNSARGREQSQAVFRNEFSFTNFSTSLGYIRDISTNWQFRSNVGSAWRPPNMLELYGFGTYGFKGVFGLWRYYYNANGTPQSDRVLTEDDEAIDVEKGYKWINELAYKKNNNVLTMTLYGHFIENFIFERPETVSRTFRNVANPIFFYDQANALFVGTDLTYSHRFNEHVKSTLGISYLWSKNVEENEPLINQPPININAELSWQTPTFLGLDFSQFTIQASYTLGQFQAPVTITISQILSGDVSITQETEIFDFKDVPDGYFLGHTKWRWKLGKFGGEVEIRNILNSSYRDYLNQMRYFADEPGRNYTIQINYSL